MWPRAEQLACAFPLLFPLFHPPSLHAFARSCSPELGPRMGLGCVPAGLQAGAIPVCL